MGKRCFDRFLAILSFGVLTSGLPFHAGCGRELASQEKQLDSHNSSPTGAVSRVNWAKTADQQKLINAQDCLDSGDERGAMRLARELMSSKEREVRSDVTGLFSWIGKHALPELIVMMRDKDVEIAEDALRGYEFALSEISSDYGKICAITNAVAHLDKSVFIDSILHNLDAFDEKQVLLALDGLIVGDQNQPYAVCAKRVFEEYAGEPWVSSERTRRINYKKED